MFPVLYFFHFLSFDPGTDYTEATPPHIPADSAVSYPCPHGTGLAGLPNSPEEVELACTPQTEAPSSWQPADTAAETQIGPCNCS